MSLHIESVGVGPPLLLLHGWALHAGIFASLLPALAARHRVHALDLPGHGHSPTIAPYTLDAIVDAVVDALPRDVGVVQPLAIVGWSFGGLVAQRLAHRYRGRVARLVLICTTPRFVNGAGWSQGVEPRVLAQFADELRVAYDVTIRRFLSLQMQGLADARATLAQMRVQLDARPRADAAALDAALAILQAADLRDAAPSLEMPTLIITGGRDALTPARAGTWLASAMPAATHAHIADAAHVPFLSHRAAFDAALAAFFDARAA
ncbi:MAG: pimeloyl-ACP methyl ester esterase BioH [Betaproteobacteria bacterium]